MSKALLVVLIVALTSAAFAQSDSEFQAKCLEEGNQLVKHVGNPFSFNIHYSKKLGGCFARVAFYEHRDNGKVQGITYLYHVFGNKIIGFLLVCAVC
jgi:hypothetical protein